MAEPDNTDQKNDLEKQRLHHEWERLKLEHYRVTHEAKRPYVEAVFRFSDLAVRSLLILNGGAALAILGFASRELSSNKSASAFAYVCFLFGLGSALAVACAGLAYLAQWCFAMDEKSDYDFAGNIFNVFAILMFSAGLCAFMWGMVEASTMFSAAQP